MSERVVIAFSGDLDAPAFAEFARHRAERLSISLTPLSEEARLARYLLEGPTDLIDAFEMALSLGPATSIVQGVERQNNMTGEDQ